MINIKEIEFKNFSEINKNDLLEFYKFAFPQKYKLIYKNWEWIYRVSLNNIEPFVATHKKIIVGHAGSISTKIKFKNKLFDGIWFVDFYILPEYRNKGLGKIMTRKWMNLSKIHLTICNDHSLSVFKNLDWSINKNYFKSCNLINPLKWIPVLNLLDVKLLNNLNFYKYFKKKNLDRSVKFYKLKGNEKLFDDLFKVKDYNNLNNSKPKVLRDQSWVNWRLFESPFIDYYFYFLIDSSFLVVSIFNDGKKKKLNIIYSFYENNKYKDLLLNNLINWSIENNIDIVWVEINNLEKNYKIRNNYTKNFKINFACNSNDEILTSNELENISNLEAIDSDVDILNFNKLNSIINI